MTENFSLKALVGLSVVVSNNWAKSIKNDGKLEDCLIGRLMQTDRLTK